MPRSSIRWEKSEEGNLFPVVAGHREQETVDGKQAQPSILLSLQPNISYSRKWKRLHMLQSA